MNKRATGTIFCLIASLLFSTRYITAAIFRTGLDVSETGSFIECLRLQGNELLIVSVITLIVGIFYLVWEEIDKSKHSSRHH